MRISRPRISLLTTLLLMTIIGMSVVVVQFWRSVEPLREQNQKLRAENKQLNEERGTLVIEDKEKLHAIQIPPRFAGEGRTSFRVYVPKGQRYWAHIAINKIPKEGLPEVTKLPRDAGVLGIFQGRLFAKLDPGEHVVTVRTVRRGGTADISLVASLTDPQITLDADANTPKDGWPTVKPEAFSVFGGGIGTKTTSTEGDAPLVLMRHRIEGVSGESLNVSYSTPEPSYPLDGMILWVEKETTKSSGSKPIE